MALSKPKWPYDESTFNECPPKTHKIVVHQFAMGDVEDPDLYAAEPIYQWQQTEAGKFAMEHSSPVPSWHRGLDHETYSHRYSIVAYFDDVAYVQWVLKFK